MWSEDLKLKWINFTSELKNCTILQAPIWDEPFGLAVDASGNATGAAGFK